MMQVHPRRVSSYPGMPNRSMKVSLSMDAIRASLMVEKASRVSTTTQSLISKSAQHCEWRLPDDVAVVMRTQTEVKRARSWSDEVPKLTGSVMVRVLFWW